MTGARLWAATTRLSLVRLRTSWLSLTLTAGVSVALVTAVAVSITALYPTLAQRQEYAATAGASVPSTAFNGRGYGLTTLGGITGVEVGVVGQILFPVLGLMLAIRLTRHEEEAGRTELLTATPVGRLAPLGAAIMLITLVATATGVAMTGALVAVGLPISGSAWYAASVSTCLVFFASVGLLLAQLAQLTRNAQQLGITVVTAAFLTRFVVDGKQWDLVWLSPLGWLPEVRAFASPQSWPLGAYLGSSLVLVALSVIVAGRRDLGAGALSPRPGPDRGDPGRATGWRLAVQLERTVVCTWTALACLWALFIGVFGKDMTMIIDANPSMLTAMGLSRGTDLMTMLISIIMVVGAGSVAVQGSLRLSAEERSGRLGLLLSTRQPRRSLWWGWWATTLTGSLATLLAPALVLGLSTWVVTHEAEALAVALRVAGGYAVPVLLVTAVQALLAAVGPRWPVLGWALVIWVAVVGFLAEALRLPEWARDLSPAHLVGVLPVDKASLPVIAGQAALTLVLTLGSVHLFRHRDLSAG